MKRAAESGNAEAQVEYGDYLRSGGEGEANNSTAIQWYEKAAAQNYTWGLHRLGSANLYGKLVSKDVARGVSLLNQCSEMGHAICSNDLGIAYSVGLHLEKNISEAERYFELAWKQGHFTVPFYMVVQYTKGGTFEKSLPKARLWAGRCTGLTSVACRGKVEDLEAQVENSQHTSPFPPAPVKRPGVVSCNTNCNNGNCYRTYDDGRRVQFEAPARVDPFTNQMTWDAGSC